MSIHTIPSEADWSDGQTQVFLFIRTAKGNVISLTSGDAVRRGAVGDFQKALSSLVPSKRTKKAPAPPSATPTNYYRSDPGRLGRRIRQVLDAIDDGYEWPTEIAEHLSIRAGCATTHLGNLKRRGLATSSPTGWSLTPAGKTALDAEWDADERAEARSA
jgi:hypothetical protein